MTAGPLDGRGAVVTGGGRGIGATVARVLAEAGAGVVIAARTAADVEKMAASLRDRGTNVHAVACDVTDEKSVKRLGEAARYHLGHVDILVNNAGASSSAPLAKLALDEWNRIFLVNATATFLCSREFTPGMVERRWGRVVNLASVAGVEGGKYIAHYSAAKHAVVGFTRSIALELASTGVTANAVCPGYVDTQMTDRTLAIVESRAGLSHDMALEAVLRTTGQERLITPEEVATAVLELCGEDAGGVTGQTVMLRGGVRTP